MRCAGARRKMLVSSRAELRAEGNSPLSAHLVQCPPCRMLAMRLEAGTDLLAELSVERESNQMVVALTPKRPTHSRFIAGIVLLPIAAALLAAVLLHRDSTARVREAHGDGQAASTAVKVHLDRGQSATVIKTRDPNVTIIWLTPTGAE